jgi:lysozyme family protein
MKNLSLFRKDLFFERIVKNIIKNKGGYVKNPSDPRGETNFGISKRNYPLLDIENLTKEQAKSIYYRDYWLGSKCNLIEDFELAQKVFDLSVNLGILQTIDLTERALRCFWRFLLNKGVAEPIKITAINEVNSKELLCALKSEAAAHYRILVILNPHFSKFLEEWLQKTYA